MLLFCRLLFTAKKMSFWKKKTLQIIFSSLNINSQVNKLKLFHVCKSDLKYYLQQIIYPFKYYLIHSETIYNKILNSNQTLLNSNIINQKSFFFYYYFMDIFFYDIFTWYKYTIRHYIFCGIQIQIEINICHKHKILPSAFIYILFSIFFSFRKKYKNQF